MFRLTKGIIFILATLLIINCGRKADFTAKQIQELHRIKTAQIHVKKSYILPGISHSGGKIIPENMVNETLRNIVPFEELAIAMFAYAGLDVVIAGNNDAIDLKFDADLLLEALRERYLNQSTYGYGGYHYSGASISGTISLELYNSKFFTKAFTSSRSPNKKLISGFRTAMDAPFSEVFWMPDSSYVHQIIEIIAKIYGTKPLFIALHGQHASIRAFVAQYLYKRNIPGTSRELIKQLEIEDNNFVLNKIVSFLGEIKDSSAVEPLIDLLTGRHILEQMYKSKQSKYIMLPRETPFGLSFFGKNYEYEDYKHLLHAKTVEELTMRLYLIGKYNHDLQHKIINALVEIQDLRALNPLLAILNHYNSKIHAHAIRAILKLRHPDTRQILENQLKNKNEKVRNHTAKVLQRLTSTAYIDSLVTCLKKGGPSTRENAIRALCELNDKRALNPLIEAVQDDYSGVRGEAITALGELKDLNAINHLIEAIQDKDGWVKKAAINALGELKDSRAINPLLEVLHNDDYLGRYYAINALKKINDPRIADLLLPYLNHDKYNIRIEAVEAFQELRDPRAINHLLPLLEDDDYRMRIEVVIALREIGDVRVIEPLIDLISDENYLVRIHTNYALRQIAHVEFGNNKEAWDSWWRENRSNFIK